MSHQNLFKAERVTRGSGSEHRSGGSLSGSGTLGSRQPHATVAKITCVYMCKSLRAVPGTHTHSVSERKHRRSRQKYMTHPGLPVNLNLKLPPNSSGLTSLICKSEWLNYMISEVLPIQKPKKNNIGNILSMCFLKFPILKKKNSFHFLVSDVDSENLACNESQRLRGTLSLQA